MPFKVLARSLARVAWRVYSRPFNRRVSGRYLVREACGFPLAFATPPVADLRFQAAMRVFATHRHREWAYDLREPCYIEPTGGFVLGSRGELLSDPFLFHHLVEQLPYRSLLSLMRQRHNIRTVECAVSLRCFTEQNYWHFYDDLLGKLRLLAELDVPRDVPLLVGERLWRQPYFQEAIVRGALRERKWTLHTSTLRVRRLVIAVPMSFQLANLRHALDVLDAPKPEPSSRRIFLQRGARRSRSRLNMADLLPVLDDCGFEIVDTDELTLMQQIALFASARLVVANHGAGLANLIFRAGQPLDLVEVFAPDYIHPHFVWLACTLGFGYDALVGEPSGGDSVRVDPTQFRAAITRAIVRIEQK